MIHERNLVLTISIDDRPTVAAQDRLALMPIDDRVTQGTMTYGYMDPVDLPSDLARSWDGMQASGGTSFYLGRNSLRRAGRSRIPGWMMPIYAFLHRNSADPFAFMGIPANRVVEMGGRLEL